MNIINEQGKALRKSLNIPEDWDFNSWPPVLKELWDEFVDNVGPENLHFVSGSILQQVVDDEIKYFVRASFFISPTGKGNIELAYKS